MVDEHGLEGDVTRHVIVRILALVQALLEFIALRVGNLNAK